MTLRDDSGDDAGGVPTRSASGLLWKLNRLRAMGPGEIAHRAVRAMRNQLEQRGIGLASPPPATGRSGAAWCDRLGTAFDVDEYRCAADRIIAGRFDVFALRDAPLGFPPDWNRDPKTGNVAPSGFGKAIDYRDDRVVGDIKYLWEPSRHLELVTLAQAWRLSGDARYAAACRRLLESWFDACPYPRGIHWTSSLEAGLRLVNWHFAWHLLGGDDAPVFGGADGAGFRARWQTSVFEHCHFIAGHLSLHSSANNHLLGEYMGLFVGALGWPLWPQSRRWRALAARGFEAEILRQNAPDGVNREQAFYYQHEVIDMMLVCCLVGRANGHEFAPAFHDRLERMLDFVAAMMDRSGRVPMVGDADDAVIVRLQPRRDANVYRPLLATGALLFGRADLARKVALLDDKTCWLLGDVRERFQQLLQTDEGVDRPLPRAFADGGYYLLGQDFDGPREIRLVADAGPLGYLSIAAHGHADALAFTLGIAGHELLIDPGTYAYHTGPMWRDYFRGTSAHNTVRIDAQDQSASGGNFMWSRHARAHCERFEASAAIDRFAGSHDGYRRLPDPVTHRREIMFDKAARRIAVTDRIDCARAHDVEVFWHFAEDCAVTVAADGSVVVDKAGITLRLSLEGAGAAHLRPECVTGRERPPLGWVSRRFDEKTAAPTVRWFGRIAGGTQWTTRIVIEGLEALA